MKNIIIGAKPLQRKLAKLGRDAPKILARGTYEAAETIMRDAKEHCPVRDGHLRASGHVMPANMTQAIDRSGVSFDLGFGGQAGAGNIDDDTNKKPVGYAAIVHERGPRKVNPNEGAERKFLERAVQRQENNIVPIIAKHADREMKRRGVA